MATTASPAPAPPAAASDNKICLCQLCTCPERLHKCVYGPGEEHLRQISMDHCRNCGCGAKRSKPYVPLGPMEMSTTYNADFQQKKIPESQRPRNNHPSYVRPYAPMQDATTYNADFSGLRNGATTLVVTVKPSTYKRPMGDMILDTTYNGDFQPKSVSEMKIVHRPGNYLKPLGPMNMDTTYSSDYTEKRSTDGYKPCCPCCNPRSHGFEPQGEVNGHTMFARKSS